MKQLSNKKHGILTLQDNKKIIQLIKAKINPIHKKPYRILPRQMITTAPNFYHKPKKQYSIIDQKQLNNYDLITKQPSNNLIKKARAYIEENRKKLKDIQNFKQNIDLKLYVRLFDDNDSKQNAVLKEFLKMKRQSLQLLSFYERPSKIVTANQGIDGERRVQASEEECSQLNARIRKKLNHKKIIALYKYT